MDDFTQTFEYMYIIYLVLTFILNKNIKATCFIFYFISPLFNQVGLLRTSSHLQLRPGQDKAKQCDTNNNTELHME